MNVNVRHEDQGYRWVIEWHITSYGSVIAKLPVEQSVDLYDRQSWAKEDGVRRAQELIGELLATPRQVGSLQGTVGNLRSSVFK